jgi:hypothetical protein
MERRKMSDQNEYMLQFFAYKHLPEHLQEVSKQFSKLAYEMISTLPRSPERTVGLRKLLEAKDCFVRATLISPAAASDPPTPEPR